MLDFKNYFRLIAVTPIVSVRGLDPRLDDTIMGDENFQADLLHSKLLK
jgi:hypothetical protein